MRKALFGLTFSVGILMGLAATSPAQSQAPAALTVRGDAN